MDIYHVYCDPKPGVSDMNFAAAVDRYLGHLRDQGLIAGWRTTRAGPVEGHHHGVNALVANPTFALTRDFPDPMRQVGEERF